MIFKHVSDKVYLVFPTECPRTAAATLEIHASHLTHVALGTTRLRKDSGETGPKGYLPQDSGDKE
jgi:hypothetical protein